MVLMKEEWMTVFRPFSDKLPSFRVVKFGMRFTRVGRTKASRGDAMPMGRQLGIAPESSDKETILTGSM